jgi:WD40 repeat protein
MSTTASTFAKSPEEGMETATVVFLDLVGYSKLPIEQQTCILRELQYVVTNTVNEIGRQQSVQKLPTGDGMALVFFGSPMDGVRCAASIGEKLLVRREIALRTGIHHGMVSRIVAINDQSNVAGGGINFAQRVMDCGDAGHILVTKAVADMLWELEDWRPALRDLGVHRVKHGVKLHIYNLSNKRFGNAKVPAKLRRRTRRILVLAAIACIAFLTMIAWKTDALKKAAGYMAAIVGMPGSFLHFTLHDSFGIDKITRMSGELTSVSMSPDGRWLASLRTNDDQDTVFSLVDLAGKTTLYQVTCDDTLEGKPLHKALCHEPDALAVSPLGSYVATLNSDLSKIPWDPASNVAAEALHAGATLIPPNKDAPPYLVVPLTTIALINPATGQVSFSDAYRIKRLGLWFTGDGKRLITADANNVVTLWNVKTLKPEHILDQVPCVMDDPQPAIASGRDGRWLALACTRSDSVAIYDGTQISQTVQFRNPQVLGLSEDNTKLAVSDGWTILIYDLLTKSGKPFKNFKTKYGEVHGLAFSPDSTTVATISGNIATVWDITSGTPVGILAATKEALHSDTNNIFSLAIQPSGNLVQVANDQNADDDTTGSVVIWRALSRDEEASLKSEGLSSLLFFEVTAQEGYVIPNATCELAGKKGHLAKVATDSEGRCWVDFVPPGTYTLTTAARGFKARSTNVRVSGSGDPIIKQIPLSRGKDGTE